MLACTFANRFGNSLANLPKVPSTAIVYSNLICEIVVVVFVAHTVLLLLCCLVPLLLWLLMLSNDNGVARLFFPLGVEAIAPAVVATMEVVEVAEEEDDNNKG